MKRRRLRVTVVRILVTARTTSSLSKARRLAQQWAACMLPDTERDEILSVEVKPEREARKAKR